MCVTVPGRTGYWSLWSGTGGASARARPLQPQVDPPCSEGVDSTATSDPEVQHTSANPRLRPRNEEQSVQFCAVTRLHNGEGSDESGRMSGKHGAGEL
ncbi:hypothetical protein NDU88_008886 [Pleurodeles waltl]|uniref:Uncharacterized protein n=1 Tax=Pleurodeles waltl TaxID=8319 RepID=A0AAV7PXX7_PLEWA|nr:hypothetical protein NDU88_008886 [Pleurodeles waltl]